MQRKNIKKVIIISTASIAAIALTVVGVLIYKNANTAPVKVFPMSSLGQSDFGSNISMSGMVTTDISQDVMVEQGQQIKEIKVKQGDTVKEGDVLLTFDTTLPELDLETEKLNKQTIELRIKGIEKNISNLKKGKGLKTATGNTKGQFTRLSSTDIAYNILDGNSKAFAGNGSQEEPYHFRIVNQAKIMGSFLNAMRNASAYFTLEIFGEDQNHPIKATEVMQGSALDVSQDLEDVTDKIHFIIKAASVLDFDSMSYAGDGTVKKPYQFVVSQDVVIMGSFLNRMSGYDNKEGEGDKLFPVYFLVEVHKNDFSNGDLSVSIFKDGSTLKNYGAEKKYKMENSRIVEIEPEPKPVDPTPNPTPNPIPKPTPEQQIPVNPETDGENDLNQDDNQQGNGNDNQGVIEGDEPIQGGEEDNLDSQIQEVVPEGMTAQERKKAISEQETNLKTAQLDLKESDLKIKKAEKKVQDATIKATIDGVVQKVGNSDDLPTSEAFIKISNTSGYYVKGNISEMMLGKIQKDQMLTGNTWESGMSFMATIKEISPYPVNANEGGGPGNPNSSYYPFIALVEEADGLELENQEYAELSMTLGENLESGGMYLEKAFIRKENGKNYVWKAQNGKLTKQEVTVGKILWGSSTEITSGLTAEDFIAFPYGKSLKEGAKTKEETLEELYGGM